MNYDELRKEIEAVGSIAAKQVLEATAIQAGSSCPSCAMNGFSARMRVFLASLEREAANVGKSQSEG
jgi:hypothetical protein